MSVLSCRSMILKAANALHRGWRRLQVFVERGTLTSPVAQEETECSHCGHVFCGNYCPRCGQFRNAGKGKPHFFKTFREAYPQLSSNFIRTIFNLALRPGYMMRDYFRGHRVLYQNPVSTFLIAISVMALCSGIYNRIAHNKVKTEKESVANMFSMALTDKFTIEADSDEQMRRAYAKWKASRRANKIGRIAIAWDVVKEKVMSDTSLYLFVLFPLMGATSYFVLRRRSFDGRRLTLMEHYIIYVYLSAFFQFVYDPGWIECFYTAWAYRGIYRLTWLKSIAYTAVVYCIAMLIVISVTLAIALSMLGYYYFV